jgi:ethanolamine ammonia-lyase large subunit
LRHNLVKNGLLRNLALADLPLRTFLEDHLISYESDEITCLIADIHNAKAFAAISHLTVGAATANR